MNKKEAVSTFDELMSDPKRKKKFDTGYRRFLLSELLIAWMEKDNESVRALAKELKLSPTVVQALRTGSQIDLKASNLLNLLDHFGYQISLVNKKTKKKELTLSYEDHHIAVYEK